MVSNLPPQNSVAWLNDKGAQDEFVGYPLQFKTLRHLRLSSLFDNDVAMRQCLWAKKAIVPNGFSRKECSVPDFLLALLFLYLAFIAVVGSIALYGKAIDKVSEKNQARAVKIHGFVMKALKFAFVAVVFLGIATGWLLAIVLI